MENFVVKEHILILMEQCMKVKFKDGQPQGQGTIIFAEGGKYVGEFREFKPWNAIEYDKERKYHRKVYKW